MKFGLTFFKKVQKFPQRWAGKVFFSMILGFFLIGTLTVSPKKVGAFGYEEYKKNFDKGSTLEFLYSTSNATTDTNGTEKGETVSFKATVIAGPDNDPSAVTAAYDLVAHTSVTSSTFATNTFVIAINKQGTSDFTFADVTTKFSGGPPVAVFSTSLSGPEISPNSTYEAALYYKSDFAGDGGGDQSFGETIPVLDFYKIGNSITFQTSDGKVGASSGNVAAPITEASSSHVSAPEPLCFEGGLSNLTFSMSGCFAQLIYYALFVPTSFILALSGQLLDALLEYTLDSASYDMSNDGFIKVGWKLIRDICNVVFIFILLYTAISTILGTGGVNIKKTIVSVVVVALLINFSLFFSGIIVDAGNILGRVFYTAMGVSNATTNGSPSAIDNIFSGNKKSVSTAVVSQFNPQNLFAQSITQGFKLKGLPGTGADPNSITNSAGVVVLQPPPGIYAAISLILAIINIATAWIFFIISFVFIGRVVGIWLAMVFSPIAFLSWTMPGQKSKFGRFEFSKWIGELGSLSMLAPFFLFFLYLILKFLSAGFLTKAFTSTTELGLDLTTMQTLIGVILPFLIVWGLLNQAKKMTVGMAGEIGGQFAAWGDTLGKLAVGGALAVGTGGAALAGRGIIGRGAASLSESQLLQRAKGKGGITGMAARLTLRGTDKLSKASFDARNSKAADMLKSSPMGIDLKKNIIGNSFLGVDDKNRGIAGSSKDGWQGMNKRREADIVKEAEERQLKGDAFENQNKAAEKYKDSMATAKESHEEMYEKKKNMVLSSTQYATYLAHNKEIAVARGENFNEESFNESYLNSINIKHFDEEKFREDYEKKNGKKSSLSGAEFNKAVLNEYKEEVSKGNYGVSGAIKQTVESTTGIDINKVTTPGSVKAGAGVGAVAIGGMATAIPLAVGAGAVSAVGGFNEKAQKSAIKAIDKKFNDKELESVTSELKKIDDDIKSYLNKEGMKDDEIKNLTNYQKQEKLTEIRKKKNAELREKTFDWDQLNEDYKTEKDPDKKAALKKQLLQIDAESSDLRDEIDTLKNLFDRKERKEEKKEKIENKINPKDKKDDKKEGDKKDEKK